MDLSKLTLSDKIIGATGILLIVDLLFLPWHDVDFGIVSETRSAVQSPNSFWGVIGLLLAIAVVALTAVLALKPETKLPEIPVTWNQAIFYGAIATVAVLLLKLVIETDYLGFGSYLGVLLAAGMTYGGYLKFQEEKGAAATP